MRQMQAALPEFFHVVQGSSQKTQMTYKTKGRGRCVVILCFMLSKALYLFCHDTQLTELQWSSAHSISAAISLILEFSKAILALEICLP